MTSPEPLREWDYAEGSNQGFHPAADIFPSMSEEEFKAFKQDIAENGLQTPIVTIPDGQIIDGRHRWRACMETKTPPKYQIYHGNPWTYVLSANLHRRHLTASQRAMVVARIADRPPGLRNQAAPRNRGADEHLPPTQAEAAELLNVGLSSVTDARRVMRRGVPELVAVVDDGLVRTGTAARVSTMDEDTQRQFVSRVRHGEKPTQVAPPIEVIDHVNGRGRRVLKHPSVSVFTRLHADNLSSGLVGIELAFQDVTRVDTGVTSDTARALGAEIKSTKTVLNRLQKLLHAVAEKG